MCRVSFHQATIGKQIKKLEKHKYPGFRKSFSTSRKGIGGRKKKKLVKVKPQHWHFLII